MCRNLASIYISFCRFPEDLRLHRSREPVLCALGLQYSSKACETHRITRNTKATLENTKGQVSRLGENKRISNIQGLKQWYGLALSLFNLGLKYVVRKINSTILNKSKQITGYAGDLYIIGSTFSRRKLVEVELIMGLSLIHISVL